MVTKVEVEKVEASATVVEKGSQQQQQHPQKDSGQLKLREVRLDASYLHSLL